MGTREERQRFNGMVLLGANICDQGAGGVATVERRRGMDMVRPLLERIGWGSRRGASCESVSRGVLESIICAVPFPLALLQVRDGKPHGVTVDVRLRLAFSESVFP